MSGMAEDDDCSATEIEQTPGLSVTKDADAESVDEAGDTIVYTISITNTGNTTLTNVGLTDLITGTALPAEITWTDPEGFVGTIDTIPVGTSVTITGTYIISQDDLDAGATIQNCVEAIDGTAEDDDCASTTVARSPALSIAKLADVDSVDAVGDKIVYTITVTNTGNTTLTNVVVTDPMFTDDELVCDPEQPGSLAPEAVMTCTATHTVTQDDMKTDVIKNVATVDTDETDPKEDGEDVPVTPIPLTPTPVTPTPTPTETVTPSPTLTPKPVVSLPVTPTPTPDVVNTTPVPTTAPAGDNDPTPAPTAAPITTLPVTGTAEHDAVHGWIIAAFSSVALAAIAGGIRRNAYR